MKNSFLLSVLSLLTFVSTAFANNPLEDKLPVSRYQFNGLSSYWFFGANVGANVFFGDHDKQYDFGKRIGPAFEIYGGKWFTDAFGGRLAVSGGRMKGLTQDESLSNGVEYDPSQWLKEQRLNYFNLRADVMFNWSNDISGFDANRIYTMIPYAGVGVTTSFDEPAVTRFSPHVGFLQTIRMSEKLDLNIDIRGNLLGDGFDREYGGRNFEGILTTAVGVNFKLGN